MSSEKVRLVFEAHTHLVDVARQSVHLRTLVIETTRRFCSHQLQRRKDGYLKLHNTGLSPSEATRMLVQQTAWDRGIEMCDRLEPIARAILVLLNRRGCIDEAPAWYWVVRFFNVGASYGVSAPTSGSPDPQLNDAVNTLVSSTSGDPLVSDVTRYLFAKSLDGFEMSRGTPPTSLRRNIMGVFAEDAEAGQLARDFQRTVDALLQVLTREVTLSSGALRSDHAPHAWESACWFMKVAPAEQLDQLVLKQAFCR